MVADKRRQGMCLAVVEVAWSSTTWTSTEASLTPSKSAKAARTAASAATSRKPTLENWKEPSTEIASSVLDLPRMACVDTVVVVTAVVVTAVVVMAIVVLVVVDIIGLKDEVAVDNVAVDDVAVNDMAAEDVAVLGLEVAVLVGVALPTAMRSLVSFLLQAKTAGVRLPQEQLSTSCEGTRPLLQRGVHAVPEATEAPSLHGGSAA
mmetsp:Transcript_57514/g.123649  ORF Transcript_57514/g.123649 Transcript_57514/m.123649 type:complete len:206 (-) Transcript_57514:29-646(-)